MIRRIDNDKVLAKHWLGFHYIINTKDNSLYTTEIVPQSLFKKDLLDFAISYYNIQSEIISAYKFTHNKVTYTDDLTHFLDIMRYDSSLHDVIEQLAKIVTILTILIAIAALQWKTIILFVIAFICLRMFRMVDTYIIGIALYPLVFSAPLLVPMCILNLMYIIKIKEDYYYDTFVCNTRRRCG